MGIQSSINKMIGSAGAAAALSSNFEKSKAESKSTGVDLKMAAKARKTAQQKIRAINENKELSNKAKSRRIGKVLDEYNKGGK